MGSGVTHAAEKLIIDTDMGPDVDDVGALAVAHYYADRGEAEILAVIVSNQGGDAGWAVPAADAVNTYYNRPDIPLATNRGPATAFGGDSSQFTLNIGSNGKRFLHDQLEPDTAEDAILAYRRILAAQPDDSVNLLVIGWMSNIANLMNSAANFNGDGIEQTGKQLLQQKLKSLIVMGGQYPSGLEFNFKFDGPSAAKVVNELDVPMVFSGYELGTLVQSGDSLVNTPVDNPVREAYRLYGKGEPYNRASWDLSVVVYAVEGLSDYFSHSDTGRNQLASDGSNLWRAGDAKGDTYLKLKDSGAVDRLRNRLNEILQAVPASCDLSVTLSTKNPSCNSEDGAVLSHVSGGVAPYSYDWSTGSVNASIQGLGAMDVSLTVRDSAGCQVSRQASLSPLSLQTQVQYAGVTQAGSASVEAIGGQAPYKAYWSTGDSGAAVADLAVGDYSVTVNDAAGCSVVKHFSVEQQTTQSEMYLEAECAQQLGAQWAVHSADTASGGKYLTVPTSEYNFGPSGEPASILAYTLNVDKQADYALYAHILAPDAGADSLWYRVNGGEWISWPMGVESRFAWKRLPNELGLAAGENTVEISFREGGLKLDKVFVSRDGTTPVGLEGVAASCS